MNNLISVIVPIYNIEGYIRRTVSSIQKQTFRNIEIILVDDGSTDNSGHIVDELAVSDSRIKAIHKENAGVASARIEGVRNSNGEWIGFVDGDDYIETNMYEKLLQNALKYKADISHCGYQMVFPDRVDYYYNTGNVKEQDNLAGLKDLLEGSFVEPGLWNKLFHKSLFSSIVCGNVLDHSIRYNEDLLMNYYLFKNSVTNIYEDFCPYHYIVRKNSAANSEISEKKLFDPVSVQKIILNDIECDEGLKMIVYCRLASIYLNGASMSKVAKGTYFDEFVAMSKKELREIYPIIKVGNCSRSLKIKCALCISSPFVYRIFHKLYSTIKNTNNKYRIN